MGKSTSGSSYNYYIFTIYMMGKQAYKRKLYNYYIFNIYYIYHGQEYKRKLRRDLRGMSEASSRGRG